MIKGRLFGMPVLVGLEDEPDVVGDGANMMEELMTIVVALLVPVGTMLKGATPVGVVTSVVAAAELGMADETTVTAEVLGVTGVAVEAGTVVWTARDDGTTGRDE